MMNLAKFARIRAWRAAAADFDDATEAAAEARAAYDRAHAAVRAARTGTAIWDRAVQRRCAAARRCRAAEAEAAAAAEAHAAAQIEWARLAPAR